MSRPTSMQRLRASRFRLRPKAMLVSAIFWAFLWSSLSPFILVSGALLGWLMGALFPLPPMHWKGKLRPLGVLSLAAYTLWDLCVSSVRMIAYAFEPKVDLHAGIVRTDLHTDDDLYQTAIAGLISLIPGTVVVEVVRHPRRLYLHVVGLDHQSEEDVQEMVHGVERRLLRAFGSDQQITDFEDSLATPTVAPATDWDAEAADALEEGEDEKSEAVDDADGGFAAGEADLETPIEEAPR